MRSPLKPAPPKPTIWIDLDNTPHVVFFEPIIEELRLRGFPLIVTARDAYQVFELADRKKLSYLPVGRHYGKNRFLKVAGALFRALQLAPVAWRENPALGISNGSRSQIVVSKVLRIPTMVLWDYEYARPLPFMYATWDMVPEVIPDQALVRGSDHMRKYPGIKENVYAWKLQPDPGILGDLGLRESELIITVRPPATEAHYHNPESEQLFVAFMEMATRSANTRIVLLPRNERQAESIRTRWPAWFVDDRTIVPRVALDGLNLIWHSDLVVSGGGTMNREAAVLGVPVYSIFRGEIGAVDRSLERSGRLVLVESVDDVAHKIRLEKRVRTPLAQTASRDSLDHIVNTIVELTEHSPAARMSSSHMRS